MAKVANARRLPHETITIHRDHDFDWCCCSCSDGSRADVGRTLGPVKQMRNSDRQATETGVGRNRGMS